MPRSNLPKSLNICMVANSFPFLGRAAMHGFLWPIAKGLSESGHKVTVLSLNSRLSQHEISRDGVTAFFLYEGSTKYITMKPQDAVYKKFIQLHSENPFHIVHSIDDTGYKIGRKKKDLNMAMAYDVEATRMNEIFNILGWSQETLPGVLSTAVSVSFHFLKTFYGGDSRLLKTADGVFVTSPQQRIVLERYYLYPDAKTFTVPYGIEIGDFKPDPESVHKIRIRWNIPDDTNVAVTITDMKDFSEMRSLLSGFQKVVLKKPKSKLLIVGNGPLYKDIEYEILMLALGKKVILAGEVTANELTDYIAISDVLVNLSSRASGFEPSLLEAMAQKKVIIGSEVSPIETIVEDSVNGFLIRPADAEGLADLLLRIFSKEIDAPTIGRAAAQRVMNIFDTGKMVQMSLDAYFKILINSGRFKKPSPELLSNTAPLSRA